MRVLLIGKDGQLGCDCHEILAEAHDLTALGEKELDITDAARVEAVIEGLRPAVVINCAAFTRVDACEQDRELAFRINVNGPRNLAASLARHGGKLLQISTDYVFDGTRQIALPYVEEDAPAPLSIYGRTKFEAEQAVMQELDRAVIVRTAWLFGLHGQNFLKTMLRLALSKPTPVIKVVNDQFGSLTWTRRLAEQLGKIIETGGCGIYHATSEGYASWFDVATRFLQGMGFSIRVSPCTTEQYPTSARRPQNSILENRRLKAEGINLMRPWQDDLDEFVRINRDFLIREAESRSAEIHRFL